MSHSDDDLYSGETFSPDERKRLRRLMKDDVTLHDMASGWRSWGLVGRWIKIIAAWIGATLGAYVAFRTFRDGGGPQ